LKEPRSAQFALQREVDAELVLVDAERFRAHRLAPEAARVFRACDGSTSVADVAARAGVPVEETERCLAELGAHGLLEDEPRTRRDVLRLAVAVGATVPLVSSIALPSLAEAYDSGTPRQAPPPNENPPPAQPAPPASGSSGSSGSSGGAGTPPDTPTAGSGKGGPTAAGGPPSTGKGGRSGSGKSTGGKSKQGKHHRRAGGGPADATVRGAHHRARPTRRGVAPAPVARAHPTADRPVAGGALPFTGSRLVRLVATGFGLLVAGTGLRAGTRRPQRPA